MEKGRERMRERGHKEVSKFECGIDVHVGVCGEYEVARVGIKK